MIKAKIYISGPISGHSLEERRARFAGAAEVLRQHGFEAVNPMDNGVSAEAPYEDHMRADLRMLLGCDGFYLLRGWMSSRGACLERAVAEACGLSIMDEFAS